MPLAVRFTFQNNKMVVGLIWDKSLKSEINFGDEILNVNGIDTQSIDVCKFLMLEIPDIDNWILELRDINTEKIKKIEIKQIQLNK